MLITSFTISILLMILLPILLAALFHRRYQAPWLLFGIGTLTFIGSQVVHLPLNELLYRWNILPKTFVDTEGIPLWQVGLLLGLTAGLCEETARAAGFWLLKTFRKLDDGVLMGIGHGGVESMIFGGVLTAATVSSLIPMIGSDLSSLNLTADQLSALTVQLDALSGAPLLAAASPLLERLLAMTLHVILSVMVLQAFRKRNAAYYVAAVVYHMLVDAGAVYLSVNVSNHWLVELAFAGIILPGVVWLALLWRAEAHPKHASQPFGVQWDLFLVSVRKELIQQWRTRRFLVVMAVFVLFGLTSPLVAKLVPDIIKNVAGAEQFADLIPTPSAVDAMAQYVKNITQFGFMLAVLLGMNAVAGEKEAGTAAMILSKPMPRWAFVLSKFTAQSLVYLSAYFVAGLGAYYYTIIIFGSLDALTFLGINLLLLLWLLTFVGASLLGSVIGSSIASAAGVGIGLAVAFLLAGNIPGYGQLFPGGLVAWASALGANMPMPANGGALAASFVLIVLCLMWSVALFERQEI